MTKSKIRTAAEIYDVIKQSNIWELTRFLQYRSLDTAIARERQFASASLESFTYMPDADTNLVSADLRLRSDESPHISKVAKLLAIKYILETCPDLPTINATLGPLYQEWEEAKIRETEEARLAGIAANEKREKMEAEKAAALAEIERKFAIN